MFITKLPTCDDPRGIPICGSQAVLDDCQLHYRAWRGPNGLSYEDLKTGQIVTELPCTSFLDQTQKSYFLSLLVFQFFGIARGRESVACRDNVNQVSVRGFSQASKIGRRS